MLESHSSSTDGCCQRGFKFSSSSFKGFLVQSGCRSRSTFFASIAVAWRPLPSDLGWNIRSYDSVHSLYSIATCASASMDMITWMNASKESLPYGKEFLRGRSIEMLDILPEAWRSLCTATWLLIATAYLGETSTTLGPTTPPFTFKLLRALTKMREMASRSTQSHVSKLYLATTINDSTY